MIFGDIGAKLSSAAVKGKMTKETQQVVQDLYKEETTNLIIFKNEIGHVRQLLSYGCHDGDMRPARVT